MTIEVTDFAERWGDVDALWQLVVERLRRAPDEVARLSRETSTHYKWLLASDGLDRQTVWLHEFKPTDERRPGYASTIHNHRYPFWSLALSGGYTNVRYDVAFDPISHQVHRCEVIERGTLREGLVYAMAPDEYHALEDIEEGTMTLIMQFAAVSAVSYSIDPARGGMREHLALGNRIRTLLSPSRHLAGVGAGPAT